VVCTFFLVDSGHLFATDPCLPTPPPAYSVHQMRWIIILRCWYVQSVSITLPTVFALTPHGSVTEEMVLKHLQVTCSARWSFLLVLGQESFVGDLAEG
jgi:hypothetical protein